jgi:hypothetical protein
LRKQKKNKCPTCDNSKSRLAQHCLNCFQSLPREKVTEPWITRDEAFKIRLREFVKEQSVKEGISI